MPEPRYRGESWQASIARADVEASRAARERDGAERVEHARAEIARAARRRSAAMTKPEPPPRRYARHGGAHPHDFRMTLEESDPR